MLGLFIAAPTLRADLFPNLFADMLHPLLRDSLCLGLFALVATTFSVIMKARRPPRKLFVAAVLFGLSLFALPTLVGAFTGNVAPITRAALLTLTPLFALVFEPYLDDLAPPPPPAALIACLTAIAGTFLVLPLVLPATAQVAISWIALALTTSAMAAASCIAYRAFAPGHSPSLLQVAPFAAVACASAFVPLVGLAGLTSKPSWNRQALISTLAWAAFVELPSLFLLFWLLPRLSASRLTTRFNLALLFPILIGAPLLGAHLTLLDWTGVALLALGTAWLALAPANPPDSHSFLP